MKTYKILDTLVTLDKLRYGREPGDPVVKAVDKKTMKLLKKLK